MTAVSHELVASRPKVRATSPGRVLFALTDQEIAAFFPSRWPIGQNGDYEWLLCQEKSHHLWRRLLVDFRPDALVSCWSTPSIDPNWITSPEFSLNYVCHIAGSVRHVVPREFMERGGLVTNWGGAPSSEVAEHALLLALSALRNAGSWWPHIESNGEQDIHQAAALRTRTLFGKRVGIHGFGRIARALVSILRPFNVSIHCYSDGVPPSAISAFGLTPCSELSTLFSQSEVLFECEALTPFTRESVTEQVLSALPQDAVFVNVGRGCVVDESALIKIAKEGRIRIALDVACREPLGPDTPFHQIKGAIISPHIGGPTFERFPECGELALQNLDRFLAGDPLPEALTLDEYDRST